MRMEETLVWIVGGAASLVILLLSARFCRNIFIGRKLVRLKKVSDSGFNSALLMEIRKMLTTDWKDLGRALGVQEETLRQLEIDNQGSVKEAIYQMLITWKNDKGQAATVNELVRGLRSIERNDIVEHISSMTSPTTTAISNKEELFSWHSSGQSFCESPLTLKKLQDNLRRRYKMFTMRGLPWMDNVQLSLDKHFVQLEIISESGDVTNPLKRKFELEQIFDSNSPVGTEPSRILVEGDPGFEKTTLATKLCFDFSQQKHYIRHFDLVFFLSLRNFVGSLEEMLFQAADVAEKYRTNLYDIIYNESHRTLLILDGFDELPNEYVEIIRDVIRGDILFHFTLLVTSRSGKYISKPNRMSKHFITISWDVGFNEKEVWDKRTKIIGISAERQSEFIEKHLLHLCPNEKESLVQKIAQMNELNVLTSDFLQCPLFFLMIVLLLTSERTGFRTILSRTELYKGIMKFVMLRYLTKLCYPCSTLVDLFSFDLFQGPFSINLVKRLGRKCLSAIHYIICRYLPRKSLFGSKTHILYFDNVHGPFYMNLMRQLGEISLRALKDKRLYFTSNDFAGYDKRILDMGILTQTTSVNGFQETEFYEPVHRSLLEFSAAYLLWSEFFTIPRDQWVKHIHRLRPTIESFQSSLVFPFLVGLMGTEARAIFDSLKPYAIEYSAAFDTIIPTLCELEATDSNLSSVIPLLPYRWCTYWSKGRITSTSLPYAIMSKGIKAGKIEEIYWDMEYPVRFLDKINIEKLTLYVGNDVTQLDFCEFNEFKCRYLTLEFSSKFKPQHKASNASSLFASKQFEGIFTLFDSIQCARLNFLFWDAFSTKIFLPIIHDAVVNGQLRHAETNWFNCEFQADAIKQMDLLIDMIHNEKIVALRMWLSFLPSEEQLSNLFKSMSKSSRLKRLSLFYEEEIQQLTVDLVELCNGGKKSYEWLCLYDANIKCHKDMANHNLAIDYLELRRVKPIESVRLLVESCRIESFLDDCSILSDETNTCKESITNLNIVLDETFFHQELISSRLSKFPNLQILTLTMTSFEYEPPLVDFWLPELNKYVYFFKGIEIEEMEDNTAMAMQIVDGIAKHLELISLSTIPDRGTASPIAKCSEPSIKQLQFLSVRYSANPKLNESFSPEASDIREFISLVLRMKRTLRTMALSRLDIIFDYFSVLQYMSKFKPQGFSSLVDMFPPEEKFCVKHDSLGTRGHDSVKNRILWECGSTWINRFSVTFRNESDT